MSIFTVTIFTSLKDAEPLLKLTYHRLQQTRRHSKLNNVSDMEKITGHSTLNLNISAAYYNTDEPKLPLLWRRSQSAAQIRVKANSERFTVVTGDKTLNHSLRNSPLLDTFLLMQLLKFWYVQSKLLSFILRSADAAGQYLLLDLDSLLPLSY